MGLQWSEAAWTVIFLHTFTVSIILFVRSCWNLQPEEGLKNSESMCQPVSGLDFRYIILYLLHRRSQKSNLQELQQPDCETEDQLHWCFFSNCRLGILQTCTSLCDQTKFVKNRTQCTVRHHMHITHVQSCADHPRSAQSYHLMERLWAYNLDVGSQLLLRAIWLSKCLNSSHSFWRFSLSFLIAPWADEKMGGSSCGSEKKVWYLLRK